jgi:hypothetical protein
MQITAKLAALCLQDLQKPDDPLVAFAAMEVWLTQAMATMRASPESHAAAAVRQQLQDSRLLQHLGPAMDAAAARLTAAVAALQAAAGATSNSSRSSNGASAAIAPATEQDSIQKQASYVMTADEQCGLLLKAFDLASSVVCPGVRFTPEIALPAAPAAMRLILTGWQACSKLQQLWQQKKEQLPLQVGSTAMFLGSFLYNSGCLGLTLPAAVYAGTLGSSVAGRQLLLSPAFAPCLTILLLVTVLGLDTSSAGGSGNAATAAPNSSSVPGVVSSTALQMPGAGTQQEEQTANSGSSSGSGVSSGVQVDSLTPLSCSLFDVLGVSKETVQQAAKVAKAKGLTTVDDLRMLVGVYRNVRVQQVSQCVCVFY